MSDAAVTDIISYLRIDERLETSGQPSEAELAAAARGGVEVVVNLALHDDPRYSLPDETASVESLGMIYVHIPVPFTAPAKAHLEAFFTAMDAHEGKRLLIHCAANKRVTAFLGLYRILRQGWETERAFGPMKSIWEPNEIWTSFIGEMLAERRPAKSGRAKS